MPPKPQRLHHWSRGWQPLILPIVAVASQCKADIWDFIDNDKPRPYLKNNKSLPIIAILTTAELVRGKPSKLNHKRQANETYTVPSRYAA